MLQAVLSDDPPPSIDITPARSFTDPSLVTRQRGGGASGRKARDKSRFSVSSLGALKRPKKCITCVRTVLFLELL